MSFIDQSNLSPSREVYLLIMAFYFYVYSNDDPRDPGSRNGDSRKKKPSYNQLNGKAWPTAVVLFIIG